MPNLEDAKDLWMIANQKLENEDVGGYFDAVYELHQYLKNNNFKEEQLRSLLEKETISPKAGALLGQIYNILAIYGRETSTEVDSSVETGLVSTLSKLSAFFMDCKLAPNQRIQSNEFQLPNSTILISLMEHIKKAASPTSEIAGWPTKDLIANKIDVLKQLKEQTPIISEEKLSEIYRLKTTLLEIENPANSPLIKKFNAKIREYNLTPNDTRDQKLNRVHLLHEINFMHTKIGQIMTDSGLHRQEKAKNPLHTIADFQGIAEELKHIGLPAMNHRIVSQAFTNILVSIEGLPTPKQWMHLYSGSSSLKSKQKKEGESLLSIITFLNQEKQTLNKNPSPEKIERYRNHLQSFKDVLLHKLSFELDDQEEIKKFRKLLATVNYEIVLAQNTATYQHGMGIIRSEISQGLSSMSSKEMKEFIEDIKNFNANSKDPIPVQAPLELENALKIKYPFLKNYALENLKGSNNINLKLTDLTSAKAVVIQIDKPKANQSLLNRLNSTLVGNFLSKDFSYSLPGEGLSSRINLTEFVSGGDLRHEREGLANQGKIINRMTQLTTFCSNLLANKAMHSDLKSTNFLINDKEQIIVCDKKTIIPINKDGTIDLKTVNTTKPYAPPELNQWKSKRYGSAEAFMTYQLGLVFYDLLFLPSNDEQKDRKIWCENRPLTLPPNGPSSPMHQDLLELINKMTQDNPNKRPKLEEVMKQINNLSGLHNNDQKDSKLKGFDQFKNAILVQNKNRILEEFRVLITSTSTPEELAQLKERLMKSDDFKTLAIARGKFTQLTGIKTSSEKEFDKMFNQQAQAIESKLKMSS